MRLIDADELLQTVSIKAVFGDEINKMKCGELRKILEMIENAPTVESQRMRGRWHQRIYQKVEMMVCSECGNEFSYDAETGVRDYNYCPNCGADMREIGGLDAEH